MDHIFVPSSRSEVDHAVVASESYGTDPDGSDLGECFFDPRFERYVHSLGHAEAITFKLRAVDEATIKSAHEVAEHYGRHVVLLKP
jgi:hypothetical protein